MSEINQYGDVLCQAQKGHGADISSQRQDDLDMACCEFIKSSVAAGKNITAIDLGGGFGGQSIRMAEAGATVYMIDLADTAKDEFERKAKDGLNLYLIQKDFRELTPDDIPENFDIFYSQRAINYVSYKDAQSTLKLFINRLVDGGMVYISAAGYDTEYGKTYPHRDRPIEDRFSLVTPDIQKKHGMWREIVTYKEDEMTQLLEKIGFKDIKTYSSPFGNIKATAIKP